MAKTYSADIANRRLRSQRISGAGFKNPGEVVAWLGAVQAQDYLGSLWALGVRMKAATEEAVERAIADRSHGPATLQDFTWWSGLTVADARLGIELAGSRLEKEAIDGRDYWSAATEAAEGRERPAYLLPPFDEYIVAHCLPTLKKKDRKAIAEAAERYGAFLGMPAVLE